MKHIVIVEDEKRIRDLYTQFLKGQGYDVRSFDNAEDAYEYISRNAPDLTLIDINMPGLLDGPDLHAAMDMFLNDFKVLVFSVLPVEEQKERMPGAWGYFDKAWGLGKLRDILAPLSDEYTGAFDTTDA